MNKRQRLEAAISGEKVDRVPVALWRHWPGDDQRADDLAAAHVEFQQAYDWDFIKVSPSSSFCLEDWGAKDEWIGNTEGTRSYQQRVIQKAEDWLSLKVLDPRKGALGRQLECIRLLKAHFGSEVPIIQTIFSPLAQAKNLAGHDQLTRNIRQNAGQVHHALQTIADTTVRFIQEAKTAGVDGIYYAVQYATYLKLSEAEYQVLGRPYDLQVLSATDKLWFNMLHLHGSDSMFKLVADYPVQAINWHDRTSEPDLAEGLKMTRATASGGVDRDILHNQDPRLFREQALEAFDVTGGRRWILGTGCVALVTTPAGNIRKLRTLADELIPG